jgi:6-phosphogluconolactonase (cycloisomerase 2 family)
VLAPAPKLPGTPTLFSGGISSITLDHTGKLLYAITDFSNTLQTDTLIRGYRIAANGQLVPLPGSPYKVSSNGILAVDPFNRFLYVLNSPWQQPGSITVYRIQSNGSLSAIPGATYATGTGPISIATDPFGRFVYVANNQSRNVSVYHVLSTGGLSHVLGSPFPPLISIFGNLSYGGDVLRVVTEPTGQFIYVASENLFNISSFRVGSDGGLTPLAPLDLNSNWIDDMAISPSGGFLYAIVSTAGLDVLRINNVTKLPEVIQGIFVGDTATDGQLDNSPVGICASPNGKFVYEGNANVDPGPGPMTLRGCTSPEKTDTEIWLTNTVSGLTRTLHFIQGRNPA